MIYNMTSSEKINILCEKLSISKAEVSRLIGMSPQNFNAKLKRNSFSPEELEQIAVALGIKFHIAFILPNGEEI